LHVDGRRWYPFEYARVAPVKDTLVALYLDDNMKIDRRLDRTHWTQRKPSMGTLDIVTVGAGGEMRESGSWSADAP